MSLLFLDGLDKYGPVNSVSANVIALLTQGEWTSATGSVAIVAPLSATGFALNHNSTATTLKTLSANYARLIGGVRFSSTLVAASGVQFQDSGADQAAIVINPAGTISVKTGSAASGTATATSTASVTANTTHHLEWDCAFSTTGPVTVWLDGIAIIGGSSGISGAVSTRATANNFANGAGFRTNSSGVATYDDFYLLDATGPAPLNAPLLTSPRIETQFPASDGAAQFAVGAAVLGSSAARSASTLAGNANQLYVRPLIPTQNCTINAIGLLPSGSNASAQLRPVLYADSAGSPGTLMSAGSTVTGLTNGVILMMPLTSPQSLVAGTRYWLGVHNDVLVNPMYIGADALNQGRWGTSTFSSGAPGTAPAMTTGALTGVVFGAITGPSNFYSVSQNPAQGNYSYVYDATVAHEDLYYFPPLSVVPSAIYATAVKANVAKSDAGAKTVSLRHKSGSTDSSGGAQAPGTSFAWLTSLFPTDPNGGGAWTKAALDAAQGGVRVES